MNKFILVKLTDGTEVVGELINDTKDLITIKKPLQIHYRYFMGGMPSVSFSRYMMFSSDPMITFDTRHIMALSPARQAFAEFYEENVNDYFGSQEQSVDKELREAMTSTQKDDRLKKILEMMPTDNATVN